MIILIDGKIKRIIMGLFLNQTLTIRFSPSQLQQHPDGDIGPEFGV
jgi:hypothetical protein